MQFVYSEAVIEADHFAVGLIPKDLFQEVTTDYIEPILITRFPLNLLHPESVVHLLREAELRAIVSLRPAKSGVFIALVTRKFSPLRDEIEEALGKLGFVKTGELTWELKV